MDKILFNDFKQMMAHDVVGKQCCIEIEFFIDGDPEYDSCWLGKTVTGDGKEVYWYGLVKNGSQAYEYNLKKYRVCSLGIICGRES